MFSSDGTLISASAACHCGWGPQGHSSMHAVTCWVLDSAIKAQSSVTCLPSPGRLVSRTAWLFYIIKPPWLPCGVQAEAGYYNELYRSRARCRGARSIIGHYSLFLFSIVYEIKCDAEINVNKNYSLSVINTLCHFGKSTLINPTHRDPSCPGPGQVWSSPGALGALWLRKHWNTNTASAASKNHF